jgi:hypothetical protein
MHSGRHKHNLLFPEHWRSILDPLCFWKEARQQRLPFVFRGTVRGGYRDQINAPAVQGPSNEFPLVKYRLFVRKVVDVLCLYFLQFVLKHGVGVRIGKRKVDLIVRLINSVLEEQLR